MSRSNSVFLSVPVKLDGLFLKEFNFISFWQDWPFSVSFLIRTYDECCSFSTWKNPLFSAFSDRSTTKGEDFSQTSSKPHHKRPTLKPQEYHSTLETWRGLNPNQRQSELTFYKSLHHLVSIQILRRSSGFRYELVVVAAMILRWFKASPRTIKLLLWLPSKVVLGIRRSFVVIHMKKRKT